MTSDPHPPPSSQTVRSLLDRMRRLQREANQLLRDEQSKSIIPQRNDPTQRSKRTAPREKATPQEARQHRPAPAMEAELTDRVGEIVGRLDLPSRAEMEELSRRVSQLERALAGKTTAKRRKR